MPPVRIAVVIIVSSGVVPCSRDEMEVSMPAMISAKVMIDTARQPERGSAARRRAPTSSDGLGLSAATALATAQTMNGPATVILPPAGAIMDTLWVMIDAVVPREAGRRARTWNAQRQAVDRSGL